MRSPLLPSFLFLLFVPFLRAEPEFPLTADSKPQPDVPKGTMIKDSYTAKEGSVFPGTQREYQIYLPAGHDQSKPAAFMVFQDGVIYQAPVVFDNLIAKKDIPPLVGIFIKPGVVSAANDNALPRFNRSYEYDSITPTYSQFLIDEFLPAIEAKHGLKLSTDPNHAAISGNSSGGICAFMAAWHRPDRFRRVFTGVGTYVGIHGADQLPVLVRKFEPKPLRVFLQSGTGDNNLYCGDWWMANQMMERSLTWAGYDVNHAWGEGGHNQKHASQIFPDVLRWLWRDWQTNIEVKANPKGESKWRGYEVVGDGEWSRILLPTENRRAYERIEVLASSKDGEVTAAGFAKKNTATLDDSPDAILIVVSSDGRIATFPFSGDSNDSRGLAYNHKGSLCVGADGLPSAESVRGGRDGSKRASKPEDAVFQHLCFRSDGVLISTHASVGGRLRVSLPNGRVKSLEVKPLEFLGPPVAITLSPDQSTLYFTGGKSCEYVGSLQIGDDGSLQHCQRYGQLECFGLADSEIAARGLCVDTNGWLYVATSLGIQVCDQAGRVNFIIPTPKQPYDVCFGGKDLGELFIACGDTIYKRPTKAKGVVSGQQAPLKPAPPKL